MKSLVNFLWLKMGNLVWKSWLNFFNLTWLLSSQFWRHFNSYVVILDSFCVSLISIFLEALELYKNKLEPKYLLILYKNNSLQLCASSFDLPTLALWCHALKLATYHTIIHNYNLHFEGYPGYSLCFLICREIRSFFHYRVLCNLFLQKVLLHWVHLCVFLQMYSFEINLHILYSF